MGVVVVDDADDEVAKKVLKSVSDLRCPVLILRSSPSRFWLRRTANSVEVDRTLDRKMKGLHDQSILTVADRSPTALEAISKVLGKRMILVTNSRRKAVHPENVDTFSLRDRPNRPETERIRNVDYVVFSCVLKGSVRSPKKAQPVHGFDETAAEMFSRWIGYATRIDPGGISRPTAILVDEKPRIERFLDELGENASIMVNDITQGYAEALGKAFDARNRVPHIELAVLVVESPTKARTISGLFSSISREKVGKTTAHWAMIGSNLLQVVATQGHVYDLSLEGGFHGVLKKKDSFVPRYGFIKRCGKCGTQTVSKSVCTVCGRGDLSSKKELMDAIRQLVIRTGSVMLATDPDPEGEKIAFDAMVYVAPVAEQISRAEFHEVTRRALEEAIRNPRPMSFPSVQSQIVRRVEDRWLGFELSRRLWDKFGNRRLSAGRAQSPILGWVADRFRESREKKNYLVVELESGLTVWLDVTGREDRRGLAKSLANETAQLVVLGEEVIEVKPRPPYTTDSLLFDSYSFLRMGPSSAMRLAQDLFETGLTTYHRTDSTRISSYGIGIAKGYVEGRYPGLFRPRAWGDHGAHEAIRPTRSLDLDTLTESLTRGDLKLSKALTRYHERLYDMIFRRFMASQMTAARVRTQCFEVRISSFRAEMQRRVEVVEKGFSAVLPIRVDPEVKSGPQGVKLASLKTLPKVRLFSVGELVAEMRRRGIGRPSTYAKLTDTMMRRRYAFEVHGRIVVTNLGLQVSDYLREGFGKYVSEETTRTLEGKMQQIEEGKEDYQKILSDLYKEVRSMPP